MYYYFLSLQLDVVPCCGRKKVSLHSSIVQIIFSFWSFEIMEYIRKNSEMNDHTLDSFPKQIVNILVYFDLNQSSDDCHVKICKFTALSGGPRGRVGKVGVLKRF